VTVTLDEITFFTMTDVTKHVAWVKPSDFGLVVNGAL